MFVKPFVIESSPAYHTERDECVQLAVRKAIDAEGNECLMMLLDESALLYTIFEVTAVLSDELEEIITL